jgi:hypothetical protein
MATLNEIAKKNLKEHLRDNPCRGIVVGLGENGNQMQVSWIMGRSENSQNRIYVVQDGILKTEAADPSKVKDPSLIIYNVMRSTEDIHVVSNGNQTDTVCDALCNGDHGFDALERRYCEPDAPNFTPRITGLQSEYMKNIVDLSVLKADPFAKARWIETEARIKGGDTTQVHKYNKQEFPTLYDKFIRSIEPGFGYMITTYMPGSKELPSFQGEPLLVPIRGSLEDAMQTFWGTLEPEFRVAVGGREISPSNVRYAEPINRFDRRE